MNRKKQFLFALVFLVTPFIGFAKSGAVSSTPQTANMCNLSEFGVQVSFVYSQFTDRQWFVNEKDQEDLLIHFPSHSDEKFKSVSQLPAHNSEALLFFQEELCGANPSFRRSFNRMLVTARDLGYHEMKVLFLDMGKRGDSSMANIEFSFSKSKDGSLCIEEFHKQPTYISGHDNYNLHRESPYALEKAECSRL